VARTDGSVTARAGWQDWLRDPARVAYVQTHPEVWPAALAAAQAVLTLCLHRAGIRDTVEPGLAWREIAAGYLWEAVQRYDARRGTQPLSYVLPWVVGSLQTERRRAAVGVVGPARGGAVVPVVSWADPVPDTDDLTWADVAGAEDTRLDAVDTAVDWARWWRSLPPRDRRLLRARAQGGGQRAAGRAVGVSQAQASRELARLRRQWQAGSTPRPVRPRGRPAREAAR
jgi:hypothetical protein